MKKLLLVGALVASLSGLTAFGQGQFNFASSARYVWDDWSTTPLRADQSNNVAFLFGTGTPLVGTVMGMTQVPTNQQASINGAQAWAAILTDPNFKLATNTVGGGVVVAGTSLVGGVTGSTFVATNSPSSGTITVFVIAWSSLYANPLAASIAGSPVGWGTPFTYTIGTPPGTPANNFTTSPNTSFAFGVAPVPEPTTLALIGLGSASLLIFRRKKS